MKSISDTSGYGSYSYLFTSRGGKGEKVPSNGEAYCIQYQDANSYDLQKLRRKIVRKTQVKSLESKVSAENTENDQKDATMISTRIRADVVENRDSAKDCQTNSWKIYEDYEDSGEVGIQPEHEVATPNQKGNGCVKLEDDQGGGEIDATGATDKKDRKYEIQALVESTHLLPPMPATLDPSKYLDTPLGSTNLIQNGATTLRQIWSSCTEIWSPAKSKPITCPSTRTEDSEKDMLAALPH